MERRNFLKNGCLSEVAVSAAACGVTVTLPDPPPVDYWVHEQAGVKKKR